MAKSDEEKLMLVMNKMQMKEAFKNVFMVTNQCFEACATNFRLRKLDNDEELCIYKCIDKNEKFTMVLANHFAKVSQTEGFM
ncbi:mitochondrial import inner membrane translocase subunit 9 [Cavenderia fasciculata]|uniref:Mitochondrial import inner membrane translocase subunit n=1 Tax=Cavenderia fasciculata TaxID=261658 RepID=F4Q9J8_CACFS|nr:mitochondrial import inner membrane translocase subunit 9 [Cavenderia fasciculata]EGG15367.1 mitochondrial import inner membrane translocase subunit 9 [Cavenderia fasciculata]|eukprot:XP_004354109.1 mitochondrial import inner membrane translocase subunit 9 [Cavenderia fasciculata]